MRALSAPLRTVAATATLLAFAVPVQAVQAPGASFPAGTGGWKGDLFVSGYYSSDAERDDGSFNTSVTDVLTDTKIGIELSVGADDRLTGTMNVNLEWFTESVGTHPSTFDPYRVLTDHHQFGTLGLSGSGGELIASGELTHETNVVTDGATVEEVSGSESVAVEWVFEVASTSCALVDAVLAGATGDSIMTTVLIPRDVVEETEIHNRLVSHLIAWPVEAEAVDISDSLEAVKDAAQELEMRENLPYGTHLRDLIHAWRVLQEQIAALDVCQQEGLGWQLEFEQLWLTHELENALDRAIEQVDAYTAIDLIDLWDAGWEGSAFDSDRVLAFAGAIGDELDAAIAAGDRPTIRAILIWAGTYRFPLTFEKAYDAYYGSQTP